MKRLYIMGTVAFVAVLVVAILQEKLPQTIAMFGGVILAVVAVALVARKGMRWIPALGIVIGLLLLSGIISVTPGIKGFALLGIIAGVGLYLMGWR